MQCHSRCCPPAYFNPASIAPHRDTKSWMETWLPCWVPWRSPTQRCPYCCRMPWQWVLPERFSNFLGHAKMFWFRQPTFRLWSVKEIGFPRCLGFGDWLHMVPPAEMVTVVWYHFVKTNPCGVLHASGRWPRSLSLKCSDVWPVQSASRCHASCRFFWPKSIMSLVTERFYAELLRRRKKPFYSGAKLLKQWVWKKISKKQKFWYASKASDKQHKIVRTFPRS